MKKKSITAIIIMLSAVFYTNAQGTDPKAAIAQIKQNLDASMKNLKTFQWIETTTIFKDGEAKSQTQNQCYYDVNNKLIRVPTSAAPEEKSQRGLRGKIVENKKEEMSEYVKKCVAKIHEYLPPKSDKLQTIYASGKTNINVLEPNKKYALDFNDYLQPGDVLGVSLDMQKNILSGINVKTYVDKPENIINFNLKYAQLPDGTEYPAETIMDLKSEGLKVVIKNDGYKRGSN
jgi:hypothetical protein